jgi:hypothetical protein
MDQQFRALEKLGSDILIQVDLFSISQLQLYGPAPAHLMPDG